MTALLVIVFLVGLVGSIFCWVNPYLKTFIKVGVSALCVLVVFAVLMATSAKYIDNDSFGIVTKKFGGGSMPVGQNVAFNGENGIQAQYLTKGWNWWIWPWQYEVQSYKWTTIKDGEIAYVEALEGQPLDDQEAFAPEWDSVDEMLDPVNFLTNGGKKGPQETLIKQGRYTIHPYLFKVETGAVTVVPLGQVAVVKSNVGNSKCEKDKIGLVHGNWNDRKNSCVGTWNTALTPARYWLHKKIYEITFIPTLDVEVAYLTPKTTGKTTDGKHMADYQYGAIGVKSLDGYKFPVDVRGVYHITAENAPKVVVTIGRAEEVLSKLMNPAVRSTFRNAAETAKALDYVKDRTKQEAIAKERIVKRLKPYGITVDEILMAEIAPDGSLDDLLKTQTDRELALQLQETFTVQKMAALKEQELAKEKQKALEEKKLAAAEYQVHIAKQNKLQRVVDAEAFAQEKVISANADSEQKLIAARAEAQRVEMIAKANANKIEWAGIAQAKAHQLSVDAIGRENTSALKLMETVERGKIQITPNILVGAGGTILDALVGNLLSK
jgi:hypothetical protein